MIFTAKVRVKGKPEVNNPEGSVIAGSLRKLGFSSVLAVRAGKYFEINVEAESEKDALAEVEQMCARLLAHPLVENYECEVSPQPVDQPA